MFALEIPAISFNGWFFGLMPKTSNRTEPAMDHAVNRTDPENVVLDALAAMLPSTEAEIAEAAGLEPVAVRDSLDRLGARFRVMFNPLTKRYSLPKAPAATGIAA